MPLAGRVYVGAVGWAGLALFGYSLWVIGKTGQALGWYWLVFTALTFVSGRFTLKVPSVDARFSVSEMFAFTSVLLFGPASGALTLSLDSLVVSCRHGMALSRTLFNFGNLALSVWASGVLFFAISGASPLIVHDAAPGPELILPLAVMAAAYFAVNSGLIAVAIGFQTGQSPLAVWRSHFLWLGPGYGASASVAFLLVVTFRQVQFSALALLLPVLIVSYVMLRSSFGRLEDAKQHVDRLNSLYMSTIETLATAIDAKDDVTHDHVRRVQGAAVALAGELGINDPDLLKAIAAAGLLHDTGKIAVPEHILNKPGRLTPAEFERMKLHAPIGAEILSAIEFPYPVVPIVRHHHENWDGSGYPDGLKGTEIPIGARILSVVDCYDALTSDRPYRRRMSDADALKIIQERRGTMYDPLIVDTFARSYERVMPATTESIHPAARAMSAARTEIEVPAPAPAATEPPALEQIHAFTSLARALSGEAGLSDFGSLVWTMIKPLVPASGAALFVPDGSADGFVAAFAVGPNAEVVRQSRHQMAEGPVGWSAVNRRMIVNSESNLGVEGAVDLQATKWICTLPLIADSRLVAVLAVYAPEPTPFTEQQAQLLDLLAPRLATAASAVLTRHAAAEPVGSLPSAPRTVELRLVHRA